MEGIGLWLAKRWGEWVTVIITGSLIPVEIYECFHRGDAIKVLVLLLNIAIVIYLVRRIRREPGSKPNEQRSGTRVSPPASAGTDAA